MSGLPSDGAIGPMLTSVGNFGGYAGRAIRWLPARNGLLTCACDGRASALLLFWSFGQSPSFALGELRCDPLDDEPQVQPMGWTTLEYRDAQARALVSRAWPAVRVHHEGVEVTWRTAARQTLGAVAGQPQALTFPVAGTQLSEPWLVVFDYPGQEDAAVLLTFTRRPLSMRRTAEGLVLRFAGPGEVHAMPLEGIARRAAGDAPVDHWVACARAWVAPLLAFPVRCSESAQLLENEVRIDAWFEHEPLTDDWGTIAEPLAPLPPAVAQAAEAGYPVTLPDGLVTTSVQRNLPTLLGPFQYVPGNSYTYVLPAAVASDDLPDLTRSNEGWAAPIRQELERIVDDLGEPTEDCVDNNLRIVAFLADAARELDDPRRARCVSFAEAALAGALDTLYTVTEPFTGQAWSTLGKTWRSNFDESAPPWGKDQERFDSEFYNGQALSALEASRRLREDLPQRFYARALQLYAYDQLFFDWATGSVLTHATGDSSNIDGIQFAWEGMQAMARMARRTSDQEVFTDAMYRAARQQAAVFAAWRHPEWVKRRDYAVGHVSHQRLAPDKVETVGPVDAFVEEYGAATLQFESFWQCTCFLFYANRPLFEFYRRYGLMDRIRTIEYDIVPRLHPDWQDGNATDPCGENGQCCYGTAWTAAHLAARAALFGDDSAALFKVYQATGGTTGSGRWYCMQQPAIAGPLMLAFLENA